MDTNIFIQKSKNKFGDRFDYTYTKYIDKTTKLCITCKEHGSFYIRPWNHLNGAGGCRKCMVTSFRSRSKYTKESFISECHLIHDYKYDYSLVEYKNVNSMIDIVCPDHGVFTQIARSHKDGCGCKLCGKDRQKQKETNSIEYFIEKSNIIHESKYDYSKAIYTGTRNKIEIICPIHGSFYQLPSNHLVGRGCQQCARETSSFVKEDWCNNAGDRVGVFYIIRCFNENEYFYKYGITFNSLSKRYRVRADMPYEYEIIRLIISSDKEYIWDLEKRFRRFKVKDRYSPNISFAGSAYECFSTYNVIDRTR